MEAAASVPRIAHVRMPEKGLFTVRCADSFAGTAGGQVVVNLDYGLGLAELCDVAPYDPARDGAHPPGFTLVRPAGPDDLSAAAANESRARELREAFLAAAHRLTSTVSSSRTTAHKTCSVCTKPHFMPWFLKFSSRIWLRQSPNTVF